MALCCLFDSLRGTECAREALFSRVSEPRSNDPCVDPCVVLRLALPSFPVLSNQSLVCLLVSLSFFCLFALIWISGFLPLVFHIPFASSWFTLRSMQFSCLSALAVLCGQTVHFWEIKQERFADCCPILTATRTTVHLSNRSVDYAATRTSFPNNSFLFSFLQHR